MPNCFKHELYLHDYRVKSNYNAKLFKKYIIIMYKAIRESVHDGRVIADEKVKDCCVYRFRVSCFPMKYNVK